MDRRKSLKLIGLGTVSSTLLLDACKEADKKTSQNGKEPATPAITIDRNPEELVRDKKLMAEKFFTDQEMATIAVLSDIIIPKDEVSGSATDAKVPDFIGFIVNDMPNFKVPMRGGLRWLDIQCMKRYDKAFKDCSQQQQLEMVDLIAYPVKAKDKKDLAPGVSFFSLMRNLTATGFYTSAIGIKDVGYAGNAPNKWNGVPDDVLKQYGLAYTEKELKECVSF
jgi:gluconate 2-dehydrogenase gamma chain